jgi:hypothetical protein
MGHRGRIYFTEKQKAEILDRWQHGESMSSIGRRFDRNSSSIYPLLARTALSDKPERACEGCWSEAFKLRVDAIPRVQQRGSA